jgi:hypothetical protein
MEKDNVEIHPTQLGDNSEEENHKEENEVDEDHWVEYHEKEGCSFNSWEEMTQNWKDIPQATSHKRQSPAIPSGR